MNFQESCMILELDDNEISMNLEYKAGETRRTITS